MKHTKGEWVVSKYSATTVELKGSNRSIASTGGYQVNTKDAEVVYEENLANARLIAAAPDLFEALIEAQETINIICDRNTPNDGSPNGVVMQKIIDAIKKAKGE